MSFHILGKGDNPSLDEARLDLAPSQYDAHNPDTVLCIASIWRTRCSMRVSPFVVFHRDLRLRGFYHGAQTRERIIRNVLCRERLSRVVILPRLDVLCPYVCMYTAKRERSFVAALLRMTAKGGGVRCVGIGESDGCG
jgi:hypothetical protein